MKLIFIYGPPAVGKLTVARALAKLTGYKVFHNQLTVDLVSSIFKVGTEQFNRYNQRYRLELIQAATKENVPGLIMTYVYASYKDDEFIKKLIDVVEKHGGHIHFVQLYCHRDHLHKRVKASSRKSFTKIKTIRLLTKVLRESDYFSAVPFHKGLTIDNTHIAPKRVALKIREHYHL